MARRRYLSTDISKDERVNRLAVEAGDFAVTLYTWMIPHADDLGCIQGTPWEILAMVCPGRRDKSPEDVEDALAAMDRLGLIAWDAVSKTACFPASFYRYQQYIPEARRRSARDETEQRSSAQTGAVPRTDAQNRSSLKSSLKSSSSTTTTPLPPTSADLSSSSSEKSNGATTTGYAALLGEAFPKVASDFGKLSPALGAVWLSETLDRAPPGLTANQVDAALGSTFVEVSEAVKGSANAPPDRQIHNWPAFAEKRLRTAMTVAKGTR